LKLVPLAICGGLAALTLLWQDQPSFDPWAWIVWGRQLTGLSAVPFGSASPTGWKPLPVLINMPIALLGSAAAPIVWVWLVRTAALWCLVQAWNLGKRAAGTPAAVGAVVLLVLTPQAVYLVGGGISEVLVALLLLAAVSCHLDDKPNSAWFALLAAALARPEIMAAAGPYGLYMVWRRRIHVGWFVGPIALAALLWASGDWIGYGKPFAVAQRAEAGAEPQRVQSALVPAFEILARSVTEIQVGVALIAVLTFAAAVKWREPVGRTLGALSLAIISATVIATQLGYPGVPRYMGPAFMLASVLGGIGLGRFVSVQTGGAKLAAAAAVALIGLGVALPSAVTRDRGGLRWYEARSDATAGMPALIDAAGGRTALLACGIGAVNPPDQLSAAAYALDVHLAPGDTPDVPSMWRWETAEPGHAPSAFVFLVHYPLADAAALRGLPLTRERLLAVVPASANVASGDAIVSPIATAGDWAAAQVRTPLQPECAAAARFSRTR